MLLSVLIDKQSMRQSRLCCRIVPRLHCPLISVTLSDVFTGALLVYFGQSVSPHSVCFLSNHCLADPFFHRGATHEYSWREKSLHVHRCMPACARGMRAAGRIISRPPAWRSKPHRSGAPAPGGSPPPCSGFKECIELSIELIARNKRGIANAASR